LIKNKIFKAVLVFGLCCFFHLHSFGQKLQGQLLDAFTDLPIAAAWVSSGENATYSDENGLFEITADGEYPVLVIHINYEREIENSEFLEGLTVLRIAPLDNLLAIATSQAYSNEKKKTSLSSSTRIGTPILESGDQASILSALNLMPGVKMEERGYGGSRRINIRGSFLRSPFAVRNIKIYFEGIPMTSPDGSSPLELFDNADIGSIEVIKGPAGSSYGAGNGGVLLINGKRPSQGGLSVNTSLTAGSFGFIRSTSAAEYSDNQISLRTSFHHQQTDGYRVQEANRKQQINLFAHYYPKENLSYHLFATNYEGDWQLPGAIKAQDVEEDPTQAVEFSVEGNASVNRDRFRVGLSQSLDITDKLNNLTSLYTNQTDKSNAYGTSPFFNGWKDESASGGGIRTVFDYEILKNVTQELELSASAGVEYQSENLDLTEWENDLGDPGDLKYENFTNSTAWMAFGAVDFHFKNLSAQAGLSVVSTQFQNTGYSFASDTTLNANLNLGTVVLPRAAIGYNLFDKVAVFASASVGHSYPSLFEMVDTDTGQLDTSLNGEDGMNLEVGIKTNLADNRIYLEATIYELSLLNTIIPADEGLFENLGATDQTGLEATAQIALISEKDAFIENISLISTVAWNHYKFRGQPVESSGAIVIEETPFSGNYLTGVPLGSAANSLQILTGFGLNLSVSHNWYDKAPIINSNETWASAYHLLGAKASWSHSFGKFDVGVFGGVNNITDANYSSFLQLNGFGGKFYNPSPGRNYYGGLRANVRI